MEKFVVVLFRNLVRRQLHINAHSPSLYQADALIEPDLAGIHSDIADSHRTFAQIKIEIRFHPFFFRRFKMA